MKTKTSRPCTLVPSTGPLSGGSPLIDSGTPLPASRAVQLESRTAKPGSGAPTRPARARSESSRRRSALDKRGVMQLADHWLAVAWREKEHKNRPRSTVDAQLSEAEQLAGLIEELPPSPLLAPSCAADLREIVVATRVLCRSVARVKQEPTAFELAQEARAEGRKWVRLIVDALRFVHESTKDEGITQRLSRVDTIASSDASLAASVSLCAGLFFLYETELTKLGIARAQANASDDLTVRLYGLRHLRRVELDERAEAFHARDRLLGCLYRRVIEARSALRFIHREDPEVLARLVSPSLREKRKKRGGARHRKHELSASRLSGAA